MPADWCLQTRCLQSILLLELDHEAAHVEAHELLAGDSLREPPVFDDDDGEPAGVGEQEHVSAAEAHAEGYDGMLLGVVFSCLAPEVNNGSRKTVRRVITCTVIHPCMLRHSMAGPPALHRAHTCARLRTTGRASAIQALCRWSGS